MQQQQQEQSSKLTKLANSLGNGKAFVSEEEWRVMDKKVGVAVHPGVASGGRL